jgi:hypothetical protein
MDNCPVPPDSRELDSLRRLSARLRAGDRPPQMEIEQALEAGFARMIALEAELGRARGATERVSEDAGANDLLREISALRDVLTELRTLSGPPGPARIGYGFVLPREAQARPYPPSRRPPGERRRS